MLNNEIFFTLYSLAHRSICLDSVIVFFAQYFPYLVLISAGIFLLIHHDIILAKNPPDRMLLAIRARWKEIVLVFFSGIFAWLFAYLLKIFIHIPRPFVQFSNVQALLLENDFSFPSGHATFYMGLATAIFLSHKKAGWWFIFCALIIGLARIAAGVHFPIDILAGYVLGIIIALLVRYLYEKFT